MDPAPRKLWNGTKVAFLAALLAACSHIGHSAYLNSEAYKERWESETRRSAIAALANLNSANSTNDLEQAAGHLGVPLYLTNGDWIVIRVAARYEPHLEVTLAKDSHGAWYETKRKFSGRLSFYRRYRLLSAPGQPVSMTVECLYAEEIEASRTLEDARKGLQAHFGLTPISIGERSR